MTKVAVENSFRFKQIHIDAARNATDDFNPFHDPEKYLHISGNPFPDTIVLGFQQECLIEYLVSLYRDRAGENAFIAEHGLHFSNYQLTFANVLLRDADFQIEIRPTLIKLEPPSLSNRVVVRTDDAIAMIGYKRETATPLFLDNYDLGTLPELDAVADRSYLPGTPYFLKRKFISRGHAKNFVSGSLCDQHYYFDELENRTNFPDIYPVALTSCALLEKGIKDHHDFMANPLVYVAHNISVDRRAARGLQSNDVMHLLVQEPELIVREKGLGRSDMPQWLHRCFGLLEGNRVLFRAEVYMATLEVIRKAMDRQDK